MDSNKYLIVSLLLVSDFHFSEAVQLSTFCLTAVLLLYVCLSFDFPNSRPAPCRKTNKVHKIHCRQGHLTFRRLHCEFPPHMRRLLPKKCRPDKKFYVTLDSPAKQIRKSASTSATDEHSPKRRYLHKKKPTTAKEEEQMRSRLCWTQETNDLVENGTNIFSDQPESKFFSVYEETRKQTRRVPLPSYRATLRKSVVKVTADVTKKPSSSSSSSEGGHSTRLPVTKREVLEPKNHSFTNKNDALSPRKRDIINVESLHENEDVALLCGNDLRQQSATSKIETTSPWKRDTSAFASSKDMLMHWRENLDLDSMIRSKDTTLHWNPLKLDIVPHNRELAVNLARYHPGVGKFKEIFGDIFPQSVLSDPGAVCHFAHSPIDVNDKASPGDKKYFPEAGKALSPNICNTAVSSLNSGKACSPYTPKTLASSRNSNAASGLPLSSTKSGKKLESLKPYLCRSRLPDKCAHLFLSPGGKICAATSPLRFSGCDKIEIQETSTEWSVEIAYNWDGDTL